MNLIWQEILVYNFVMSGLVLVFTLIAWRRPTLLAAVLGVGGTVLVAVLVAALVARVPFEAMYLLCFGWFLHVPLVLLATARARWSTHRAASILAVVSAASLIAIAVDAFFVEPEWLEITTVQIRSDKVTRPWRAVLIADLQTDQVGDYERRVFDAVREAKPDIILMAGDYLQIRSEDFPQLREKLNMYLKEIGFQAPLGIYAVGGNTDTEGWERIFAGVPVTSFSDTRSCDVGELRVTGLSMLDSFDTDLRIPPDARFHIALGHGPDYALGHVQADLLLAGHTHGGQVQLPFIGPLITLSRVPRAWASGRTRLDERRTLIVSRGIGMERLGAPRLRFMCRPQLVIIDIQPAAETSQSR